MRFNFLARTADGQVQEGTIDASSREAAIEILKSQDLFVSAIEEIIVPVYAKKIPFLDRIGNKEIVLFSRQLSILLKSQVPLTEALKTLGDQTKNNSFKEKILNILEDVKGGSLLSQALASYPKVFLPFYISMVKSGEATGKLVDVFVYLADYLEKEYKFKSKIKGAMIYPAFVFFLFIIVSTLIIAFIIPQLTAVLKETNQDLPLITQIVMGLSDFLKVWWWLVFLGIIGLIIGFYRFSKTEQGKKILGRFFLKVPVLSSFLEKFYLSHFALNLSTLISGGLPIVTALEITADIVGNDVYKNIINLTKEEVRKGEAMSVVLEKYPKYISPLFYQMVLVGEKTGTLDSSLKNVVNFYEEDVDRALEQFVKLLEPLLIVVLGGTVGLLLGAVLIPIYSISM